MGTAAAVRLLPGGWPRVAAIVSLAASVGLVVLTGPSVLIPLATGLAGLLWTMRKSSRQRRNRSHTNETRYATPATAPSAE